MAERITLEEVRALAEEIDYTRPENVDIHILSDWVRKIVAIADQMEADAEHLKGRVLVKPIIARDAWERWTANLPIHTLDSKDTRSDDEVLVAFQESIDKEGPNQACTYLRSAWMGLQYNCGDVARARVSGIIDFCHHFGLITDGNWQENIRHCPDKTHARLFREDDWPRCAYCGYLR